MRLREDEDGAELLSALDWEEVGVARSYKTRKQLVRIGAHNET